jgi:hypothetical protein
MWTVLPTFLYRTRSCLVANLTIFDSFLMLLMSKYDLPAFGRKFDYICSKPRPDIKKNRKSSTCKLKYFHRVYLLNGN